MPRAPSATVAVLATLGAAVTWGLSFSVNDYGLAHVGPATFVVLRFAIAAALVMVAAAWWGRLDTTPVRQPWFWGLAAANGIGFLGQYLAQVHTTPARTALFVNTSAFAVALLERFLFRMRLGPGRIAALAVGVGGAALLITGGDPVSLEGGRLLGDLIALGAGLAWSVYFVMNREAVGKMDPLNVTAWVFALTALLLVPTLATDPEPLAFSWPGAMAVLYTGLVSTALAYGLWTYGLTRIRASASAVILLVEILVASMVSIAIGRESFGEVEAVGALLLVGAVIGMSRLTEREADVQELPVADA